MRATGHVVVLIGKPGCHLCDDARAVVTRVCSDLGQPWSEQSILEDAALFDEYWERIPVVVVDGRVHEHWVIDPVRLQERLSE